MSGDGRDVALVVHRKQGGLQLPAGSGALRGLSYLLLRCIPGRVFFRDEAEYVACRERLIGQLNRIEGALLDFCLTEREIRLIIYLPPGIEPGRFVQELSAWLRSLNERDARDGHVLAERTRSQPIESSQALRSVVCFLARYPVDQALAATPSAYRHGGHRAHLGLDPAAGLAVRLVLAHFGEGLPDGREQLRRAVRSFEISENEYERLRRVHRRRARRTGTQAAQTNMSAILGVTENEVRVQIAANVEREVCTRHRVPAAALFVTPTPPGVAVLRSVIVHVLTDAKVMRIATLARRYRRAPQTLKGEMQRHHSDPSSAALFAVDLEGLLGPNVWERMAAGDARADGLQDT